MLVTTRKRIPLVFSGGTKEFLAGEEWKKNETCRVIKVHCGFSEERSTSFISAGLSAYHNAKADTKQTKPANGCGYKGMDFCREMFF